LAHSTPEVLNDTSSLLNFQSLDPWQSALMAIMGRLALGQQFTAETAIQLHPIAIAGYLGIIVTALNLTPVGQLDGGHMIHASFGQRTGAIVGQVARLLMLLLSIRQTELLLWALLLLFVPVIDEPALNDVSELNDIRDLLALVMLGFLILIVLPFPPFLVNWLV
jgi:membrane-associated protease RseP (regulator of RpoE activity)